MTNDFSFANTSWTYMYESISFVAFKHFVQALLTKLSFEPLLRWQYHRPAAMINNRLSVVKPPRKKTSGLYWGIGYRVLHKAGGGKERILIPGNQPSSFFTSLEITPT